MKTKKIRHQFLLDAEISRRLRALCRDPRISKSDIIAKAVTAYIDRREESEIDQRYAKRLDRLSHDLGKVKSEVEIILESLAVFIRDSIFLTAHMPLPDKAIKALGHRRFEKFIEEVGGRIARGKKAFDEDAESKPSQIRETVKSNRVNEGGSLPQCSSGKINREEP